MSCFDVVYHQSTHHPGGYLAYQRSTPNSPLKKRCRLDPDLHQVGLSSPAAPDGLYYDRGLLSSFPAGTIDTSLKPDPLTSAATPSGGHSSSRSSAAASSFSSALTSPSTSSSTSPSTSSSSASSCAVASSTPPTSSSTSSAVVVALKCELMTSSSNGDDDDVAQQPVMTQPIGGNGLLLTYFSEDIDTNIDNHFHRALRLAQQHGGHQRLMGRFSAASACSSVIAHESKSQGSSSCCRQESSPLSQRSFPASFWNTVSCSSSVCPSSSSSSSTSSSSYHPSNGSWSSLMVSPKADPLAAAFTVSPNPSDPYHLNAHFASSAAASSPPGVLGPLHQDPWNPYAFCPPPPPPPSQSGYRRYRHSIHEFSFSSDSPCSLSAAAAAAGSHFGSSGMRYKSLLNGGSASSSSAMRDDPKCHAAMAADVWRSRCYGCADVTGSHIATGFTLSGDIEVTQTNLPDASVKDVYWF